MLYLGYSDAGSNPATLTWGKGRFEFYIGKTIGVRKAHSPT